MNPTEFKNKLLLLKLNQAEVARIKNLTTKELKFKLRIFTPFKEITDENYKKVWQLLNMQLAKEEKFYRIQSHNMRQSIGYSDYSHLAYNNVTDDL
jgi:predicted PP-loop superfamily ATPase